MAKTKLKPPTPEQMEEYEAKVLSIRTGRAMGLDTAEAEESLRDFMVETGIANEAPPTDFPELSDPEPDKP